MTFPLTEIIDNFDRANEGPPPSANWTNWINGLKVVGNQIKGNLAGVDNFSGWNASQFGPDVEVFMTIHQTEAGQFYVCARYNLAGTNGYFLMADSNSNVVKYGKVVGGTPSQLGSDISVTVSEGDSYGLSIIGDKLQAYKKPSGGNWAALGSGITDSTYSAAGYIGAGVYGNVDAADDFGGGTIGEIIGYETIGANNATLSSGYIAASALDAPTINGVIDKVWIYSNNMQATEDLKVGVYSNNAGVPGSKIGSEVEFLNVGTWAAGWKEFSGLNIPVEAGKSYWLCVQFNEGGQCNIYYDTPSGTNRYWDQTQTYGSSWPSNFTNSSSSSAKYSMKAKVNISEGGLDVSTRRVILCG